MEKNSYYLVNANVLPPVFEKVLLAKEYLANGTAANASQAAKLAGISRSAFYKYRDFVFRYKENDKNTVNLSAVLCDRAGAFSALTTALYKNGANIITVNQGMPVDGTATVSLTVRTDNVLSPLDEMIEKLKTVDGVLSVKAI